MLRQTPGGLDPAEGEIRYSYNAADQVLKVELYTNGGYTLLSQATYNGDGERMTLTTYALGVPQTITYLVAGKQLLAANDGRQTTLYLPGQKTILAEHNGSWSYPLYDATGSIRQLVDGAATINSSRSYKPFGGILAEEGTYETTTPKNKTKEADTQRPRCGIII